MQLSGICVVNMKKDLRRLRRPSQAIVVAVWQVLKKEETDVHASRDGFEAHRVHKTAGVWRSIPEKPGIHEREKALIDTSFPAFHTLDTAGDRQPRACETRISLDA